MRFSPGRGLRLFFLPQMNRHYLFRVIAVSIFLYLFFRFVCLPFRIHGHSMAPAYMNGGFNFCFRFKYALSGPERNDVVAIRLAGEKVLLLKRVVALEGDIVAFQDGALLINNEKVPEPYLLYSSSWNLPRRTVKKGHVYVVGDNRGEPMASHTFGQVSLNRIVGGPLW